MRRFKRIAALGVVYLLAGFASTIALSYGMVFVTPWRDLGKLEDYEYGFFVDPIMESHHLQFARNATQRKGFGFTIIGSEIWWDLPESITGRAYGLESFTPPAWSALQEPVDPNCPALGRSQLLAPGYSILVREQVAFGLPMRAIKLDTLRERGSLARQGYRVLQELPKEPIWVGMFGNTLIGAVLLVLLTLLARTCRRRRSRLRIQRNQCGSCGYKLVHSQYSCPECGCAAGSRWQVFK